MTKSAIAVGATLLAATSIALITPKFIGNTVDTNVKNFVTYVDDLPGYEAELLSSELGWFGATNKIRIKFEDPNDVLKSEPSTFNFNFDLRLDTQHGPFLTGESSTIGLASWKVTIDDNEFTKSLNLKGQPFYQLDGLTSLSGNHYFKDFMPTFSTNIEQDDGSEPTKLDFAGYTGKGEIVEQDFKYYSTIGKLTMTADNGITTFDKMSLDATASGTMKQFFEDGFYDSDFRFKIGELMAKNDNLAANVQMNDLLIYATSELHEELNSGDSSLGFSSKSFKNDDFVADDMVMEFELNSIDIGIVRQFQDMQNGLVGDDGLPDSVATQEKLREVLTSFMSRNPEINLSKLKFTLEQGQFDANIHTKFVDALPVPPVDQWQDPGYWLGHLFADGLVTADKEVMVLLMQKVLENQIAKAPQAKDMSKEQIQGIAVAQAGMAVQNLVAQGFLVEMEKGYQSKLSFKDWQFMVNEQVIPLPI